MKAYEHVIGEAKRIELDEHTGKLFVVFEIIDEKIKQQMRIDWTKDMEFRIINKTLIQERESI